VDGRQVEEAPMLLCDGEYLSWSSNDGAALLRGSSGDEEQQNRFAFLPQALTRIDTRGTTPYGLGRPNEGSAMTRPTIQKIL
jgi:hypothetical protein